jgi:hypothetical protein
MKASEIDKLFDEGKDVLHLVDWKGARRPGLEARRVNVDFPNWMVEALDKEARKRGVTRQSLIKLWLADKLESMAHRPA